MFILLFHIDIYSDEGITISIERLNGLHVIFEGYTSSVIEISKFN